MKKVKVADYTIFLLGICAGVAMLGYAQDNLILCGSFAVKGGFLLFAEAMGWCC